VFDEGLARPTELASGIELVGGGLSSWHRHGMPGLQQLYTEGGTDSRDFTQTGARERAAGQSPR
jgi:hypothetical protein